MIFVHCAKFKKGIGMDFKVVEQMIVEQLDDATVEVTDLTGTQDHLGITVASRHFAGKLLLKQHQMIMDILRPKLDTNEIHAVQIKTIVKE